MGAMEKLLPKGAQGIVLIINIRKGSREVSAHRFPRTKPFENTVVAVSDFGPGFNEMIIDAWTSHPPERPHDIFGFFKRHFGVKAEHGRAHEVKSVTALRHGYRFNLGEAVLDSFQQGRSEFFNRFVDAGAEYPEALGQNVVSKHSVGPGRKIIRKFGIIEGGPELGFAKMVVDAFGRASFGSVSQFSKINCRRLTIHLDNEGARLNLK